MGSGLSHEPDCRCGHALHSFACEDCDCPTSTIGAAWNHAQDMEDL